MTSFVLVVKVETVHSVCHITVVLNDGFFLFNSHSCSS